MSVGHVDSPLNWFSST